ncbi:hypothetical protein [Natronorarus salvus]|uniref:hypothetical protein n=1 Tax=Natronorarus salvus TaxID=3117733 RepID=UPI002F260CB3
MTTTDGGQDETAMCQFRALRRQEGANMLNHTKIRRMADDAGLTELVDAVDEGRYYELVVRYRAESRSDDSSAGG